MRKITNNNDQYKVTLPIALLRKMNWDHETTVRFQEVETSQGKGILILPHEVMKLE